MVFPFFFFKKFAPVGKIPAGIGGIYSEFFGVELLYQFGTHCYRGIVCPLDVLVPIYHHRHVR